MVLLVQTVIQEVMEQVKLQVLQVQQDRLVQVVQLVVQVLQVQQELQVQVEHQVNQVLQDQVVQMVLKV